MAHEISSEREDLVFHWARAGRVHLSIEAHAIPWSRRAFACTYRVRLEGGRITLLEATGRTSDGLNFDQGCFVELRHCADN